MYLSVLSNAIHHTLTPTQHYRRGCISHRLLTSYICHLPPVQLNSHKARDKARVSKDTRADAKANANGWQDGNRATRQGRATLSTPGWPPDLLCQM